ncbi:hypothetical protein [Methylocystis sp. S23]|jgi:hypothetical protein
MANKQQRGNREAKKPKKLRVKITDPATGFGIIDRAREWTGKR